MWPRPFPLRWGWLIASLLWIGAGHSQDFEPIRAPEFYRESLLNGMQILFLPEEGSRSPFVLMIKNGAAFDPAGKKGLTQVTASLIVAQEKNREGVLIGSALEELGAELEVRVGWDAIFFHGSAPGDRMIEVLNLLGAAMARPQFSQPGLDRLRRELIGRVEREQGSLAALTQERLRSALFGPNPYAYPVLGTVETLRSVTLVDVKRHYRRIFVPNQAQLAFFHRGDRGKAFGELSRNWGRWVRQEPLPFTFRPADPPGGKYILLADRPGPESMFRWGMLSPEAESQDLVPLMVLEQYLTLSLPGWAREVSSEDQIRAAARMEVRKMAGHLQLSIQTRPEWLVPFFRRFSTALDELRAGGVDQARLGEAKRLVYQDFRRALEDPEERLYRLLETDLYRWGINFIVYFGLRLDRVTPQAFQEAVSLHVPPEPLVLVVAGPAAELEPGLRPLGEIHRVP